ncbi:selenium-binding protein SBP56-related protein [Methylocapsa sp. D3K7]|nr:selenium-binding protein SBP56-related protein [Methylocapsa sp. D3K7]WGJ16523.1 selenium-binding protein SBP56-related protein [Methylocapsa sp. D3K7]
MKSFVGFACVAAIISTAAGIAAPPSRADETCLSPYTASLIKGQEAYLHVWTLGEKGLGDESDKLVTIGADPKSSSYGKVINSVSVGGRGEAHHMGFTDDRKYLWAGRLDDCKIFIFDVGTDPSHPALVKTITDLTGKTGYIGPHTFYAIPGRMVIGALSNDKTRDGVTGIAVYSNKGEFLSAHPIPADNGGDGYGYDIAINPKKNVFLTSSFTGWNNYMMDIGKLIKDAEAMKHFGNTMVLWNLKSMQPEKILSVPGAPLEIRWSLKEGDDWAITASALTSKLWLINHDAKDQWQAKEVGTIGDPAKIPLPVDISISADGTRLWVNTFMDGTTHLFDISDPEHPKQIYEKVTGKQVNMISQSWDGKRVYITSSLLENWDKKGDDNEQVLRAYDWDGKDLALKFEVDFFKDKLGRPHHMKFSGQASKASLEVPGRLASQ